MSGWASVQSYGSRSVMFWMYSVPTEPSSKGLSYGPDMMPVSWANAVTTLRGQYCVVYRAGRAAREPGQPRGAHVHSHGRRGPVARLPVRANPRQRPPVIVVHAVSGPHAPHIRTRTDTCSCSPDSDPPSAPHPAWRRASPALCARCEGPGSFQKLLREKSGKKLSRFPVKFFR